MWSEQRTIGLLTLTSFHLCMVTKSKKDSQVEAKQIKETMKHRFLLGDHWNKRLNREFIVHNCKAPEYI